MSNLVEIAYNEQIQKIKASGVKMVDNSTWQYRLNNCKKCKHYQKVHNKRKYIQMHTMWLQWI